MKLNLRYLEAIKEWCKNNPTSTLEEFFEARDRIRREVENNDDV